MSLAIGCVCDLGIGKTAGGRSRNEDNFLVCHQGEVWFREDGQDRRGRQDGAGTLVAVCDGMGGHEDGHVASTTAVRVMAKLYQPDPPKSVVRVMHNFVLDAHRALHRAARKDGAVTMGTTLTAAWIVEGVCAWVHVGDSRLYLVRQAEIFRLTADQTRDEFARRDGRAPGPMGEHLAQNFIYGSRGLGNDAYLRIDKGLDCGAEVLRAGDVLLLCSDGVSGVLSDYELVDVLGREKDPQRAAATLLRRALDAGSRDNVTALVVRVDRVPEQQDLEEWLDDPEETIQF